MSNEIKFSDLGLSPEMMERLNNKGFENATPIQAQAIPFLLTQDQDLIGKAQTGTGKTAAFGIPIIEQLKPNKRIYDLTQEQQQAEIVDEDERNEEKENYYTDFITSKQKILKVLEINAGLVKKYNIKIGNKISFK